MLKLSWELSYTMDNNAKKIGTAVPLIKDNYVQLGMALH